MADDGKTVKYFLRCARFNKNAGPLDIKNGQMD